VIDGEHDKSVFDSDIKQRLERGLKITASKVFTLKEIGQIVRKHNLVCHHLKLFKYRENLNHLSVCVLQLLPVVPLTS
jgi:hypothetical protein